MIIEMRLFIYKNKSCSWKDHFSSELTIVNCKKTNESKSLHDDLDSFVFYNVV